MSYDQRQRAAQLRTWPCCGRTVLATVPEAGCLLCVPYADLIQRWQG